MTENESDQTPKPSLWDNFIVRTKAGIIQHIDETNNANEADWSAIPKFFPAHSMMLLLLATSLRRKELLEMEFEDKPYNMREALEEQFSLIIKDLYHEVLKEYEEENEHTTT